MLAEQLRADGNKYTPVEIVVLDQLKPWPKNPRVQKNPRYQDIKDGIKASGKFIDILAVTVDPDFPNYYVPRRGGNTRAEILIELANEDNRFAQIKVQPHEWPGDLIMLSDALQENTNRGGNNLIDEANAVANLLNLAGIDRSKKSIRELTTLLKEMGHSYSRSKLTAFFYLYDRLIPTCELSLASSNNGSGPKISDIENLKNIEDSALDVWRTHTNEPPINFLSLYSSRLSALADPFDVHRIQHEIARIFSEELNLDYDLGLAAICEKNVQRDLGHSVEINKIQTQHKVMTSSGGRASREKINKNDSFLISTQQKDVSTETELQDLRHRTFDLAAIIAASQGLKPYVLKSEESFGYYITIPKTKLNNAQSATWWFLASMADGILATPNQPLVPITSISKEILESDNGKLMKQIGLPTIGEIFADTELKKLENYSDLFQRRVEFIRTKPVVA